MHAMNFRWSYFFGADMYIYLTYIMTDLKFKALKKKKKTKKTTNKKCSSASLRVHS